MIWARTSTSSSTPGRPRKKMSTISSKLNSQNGSFRFLGVRICALSGKQRPYSLWGSIRKKARVGRPEGEMDLPASAGVGFERSLGDHADEARLPGPNDEQPAHGGTVSVGAIRRACHAKPDARLRAADREDFPERLSQSRRAAMV